MVAAMSQASSTWVSLALSGVVFIAAGATGFMYTAFYSGWGHSPVAALPVGLGLGAVAVILTGMATETTTTTAARVATASVGGVWVVAAVLMYWAA